MSNPTAARLVLVALLVTLAFLLAGWLLYRLQTIVVWSILAIFVAVAPELSFAPPVPIL